MIYPFKCQCGAYSEEVMAVKDYTDKVYCGECGKQMQRIFTPSRVSVPQDRWNPALGCNDRFAKDKIRQLRDRGMDIEETGNDCAKVKPRESNYDLTGADVAELNRIMG